MSKSSKLILIFIVLLTILVVDAAAYLILPRMGIRGIMMYGPLIFPASFLLLTKSYYFPGGRGFERFLRGVLTLCVSFFSLLGVSLYMVFSYLFIVEGVRAGLPVYVAVFLFCAFCMNFMAAVFFLEAVTKVFAVQPKTNSMGWNCLTGLPE